MTRIALLYGLVLAAAALVLQWLDLRHALSTLSTELYVLVIAVGFTALGLWAGRHLTRASRPAGFERNDRALASLGISQRQQQVLELLARGHSNQEIADRLHLSVNTVKTHVSGLYHRLGVSRRTEAIHRARSLRLIP